MSSWRAVLASLGLHERVMVCRRTLGAPLGDALVVRMGLHTGMVAVGGIGDASEMAAGVVGGTASLAIGLQACAEPDMTLCSEATVRFVQDIALVEEVDRLDVVGHPAPIRAYKLVARTSPFSPREQRATRSRRPFVGRERELSTLQAVTAQMLDGQGQAVGIVGAPGIGKSRLLAEYRACMAETQLWYLPGRCLSYGHATPYFPVVDILWHSWGLTHADPPETVVMKVHQHLQQIGMAPEEWAPYFLQLMGVPESAAQLATLSPQVIKTRTLEALVQLCLQRSQQQPLIVEIEDAHWIDATSEDWLAALVERLAGVPILVLVTYRSGYQPRWLDKSSATQIALSGLQPTDSLQMMQSVPEAASLPDALTQEILAKADGNPFFLEELLWSVAEQDDPVHPLVVPETIQAVLATRIDRLPSETKRLLQLAAVIGKEVLLPLLQAVTAWPEEDIHAHLDHLQRAEFLYTTHLFPELVYAFKHSLTQDAACQLLLQHTRQHDHYQVLEAYFPSRVETQPELLAYHYTEAGRLPQAIHYWQQAGQRTLERSAYVESISHLRQGLELLATLPQTPERTQQEFLLQTTLGPALMVTQGYAAPEVERTYARAYALCQQVGAHPRRFPVLLGLWGYVLVRGEYQAAQTLGEQCLAAAQHVQRAMPRVHAHFALGVTLFWRGALQMAHAHLEQAMTLEAPQKHRDQALRAVHDPVIASRSYMAMALWLLGYPDQALSCAEEALTMAQELHHPHTLAIALNCAVMVYLQRGEAQLTQQHAGAEVALCREEGFAFYMAMGSVMRGWALATQGQGDKGLMQIRQGMAAYQATGAELARPGMLALLAEAYGHMRQPAEGLSVLTEALDLMDQHGERIYEAELRRLHGEFLLKLDSTAMSQAEQCFHQALDVARRQGARSLELRATVSLSRLKMHQECHAEARQQLAEVYGWFTEGFDTADLQEARALLEALEA